MASIVYNKCKELLAQAALNWDTADIRAALVKSTYTADADQNFLDNAGANDVVDHECGVASYARVALTNTSINRDDTNDVVEFLCDDVAFGALEAGETIGGVVIYLYNASDAAAALLVFDDLTGNQALDGNTVTYQPASGVVFKI